MKGNMSPGKEAVTADGVSVSDWRASFDQSETGEKADMFKGVKLHKVGENHTTDGYIVTDENIKVTFLRFNLIELELFIFASFNIYVQAKLFSNTQLFIESTFPNHRLVNWFSDYRYYGFTQRSASFNL